MTELRPISVTDRLEMAQRFAAAGRLDESETLLSEILRDDQTHREALRTLAGVALTRRQGDRASQILAELATADPNDARVVSSLGVAHQMQGRFDDAAQCFERAVALAPADGAALLSLGTVRFMRNDVAGAREAAERLLARDPDNAGALSLLGVAAMVSEQHAAAEAHMRRALELSPDDAEILRRMSILLFHGGRLEEAVHFADRARLAAPLDVGGLEHLARCLAAVGRHDEAIATCRNVLAFAPNNVTACETLARVMIARGSPDAGIAELSRLVKARPNDIATLLALAGVVRFAGRLEQALPFVEHALRIDPQHERATEVRQEMRLALGHLPDPTAVEASALPLRVTVPPRLPAAEFVFFARFIPRLETGDGVVKVDADERFIPGLTALGVAIDLGPQQETEVSVALPALMRMYCPTAAGAGEGVPYLRPTPRARAKWQHALSEHPGPLVGVLWDDDRLGFTMDQIRAVLPEQVTPISLMGGRGRHDLRDWPTAVDAGPHLQDLEDLIGAVSCLDVVIGPDITHLHVCGALGRPGVAIVPAGLPWYWANAAGRSIWYPSIEVVRQDKVGHWDAAMRQIGERLARLLTVSTSGVQ